MNDNFTEVYKLLEAAKQAEPPPVLQIVQASTWAGSKAKPRDWEVPDMIPRRQVTLLAGDGGIGKTIVALQLALAASTATGWLITTPRKARVLYVGAEDEMDELHRRVKAIAAASGVDLANATDFYLCSLVAEETPALVTFGARNEMAPTPKPRCRSWAQRW